MKRRQLTPEQTAARDARRAKFKALWKQVADMPEAERAQAVCGLVYVSCDGAGYSGKNMLLIALQFRGATVLGGFRQWLKHGRAVRKGQHGISIWVPVGYKQATVAADGAEVTETDKTGFVAGTIFDISQTEPIETQESLAA